MQWIMEMTCSVPLRMWTLTSNHPRGEELEWTRRSNMSFSHSGFPSSQFPPMRILVWNIRGAGSDSFLRTTRDLIRSHDPVVMLLVETKVNNSRADRIIWSLGFFCFGLGPSHFLITSACWWWACGSVPLLLLL